MTVRYPILQRLAEADLWCPGYSNQPSQARQENCACVTRPSATSLCPAH
jgi:hypothetical protein